MQQEAQVQLKAKIASLEAQLDQMNEGSIPLQEHQKDMAEVEQELRSENLQTERLRQEIALLQSEKQELEAENSVMSGKLVDFDKISNDSSKVTRLEFQLKEAKQEAKKMAAQLDDNHRKQSTSASQQQSQHEHELRLLRQEVVRLQRALGAE